MTAIQERPRISIEQKTEKLSVEEVTKHFRDRLVFATEAADIYRVDLRFLGGVVGDVYTKQTKLVVLPDEKVVCLFGHNPLKAYRTDGTIKDIDSISLTPEKAAVDWLKLLFKVRKMNDRNKGIRTPDISIEPTFYENKEGTTNPWPERKRWKQLVSTIDHDASGYNFTFGSIRVPVTDRSLEKWTLVLEDGTKIPTIHPYGNALRYFMRFPCGLKPKDREKIDKMFHFGLGVLQECANETGGKDTYAKEFQSWFTFIDRMMTDTHADIALKGMLTSIYWKTIGTTLAHGRGPFGFITEYSDRGTGE